MRNFVLLSFAGLLLAVALVIAWVLGFTLFFPGGELARYIVIRDDLIRAHIDFLMMAQFVAIFALLLRQYSVNPPWWMVGAICYGAFFNPLAFVQRAMTPKAAAAIPAEPYFPIPAAISFSLVTIGFLGAVVLVVRAAWKSET